MPVFDFADTIACFGEESITIKRRATGPTFTNGFATKPAPTDVVIAAVIWPSEGTEIRVLPEGLRTSEARTLVTTSALQAGIEPNNAYADRFTYGGFTWEIQAVMDWGVKGNFYMGVAVKLDAS